MSYEYSDRSQRLNLPNPFRLENYFLYALGIILLVIGFAILWTVREHLQSDDVSTGVVVALGLSISLMSAGGAWLWRGLSQMNYFVGRGLPKSLAPEVPEGSDGTSNRADFVRETIRNGAVTFRDPGSNPLFRFLPNLIFAPQAVRSAADLLGQNGVALIAYVLSLMFALILNPSSSTASWLGLFYLILGYGVLFRPMLHGNLTGQNLNGRARLSIPLLVLLVVFAVIGPVLLSVWGDHLPALPIMHINAALLLSALVMLVAIAFGIGAIAAQIGPAPSFVGSAHQTEILTMNSHPAKLMEQINRMLMERWLDGIPNRRYSRISPEVSGRQGSFRIELLEETQPIPAPGIIPANLAHALGLPRFRWLVLLSFWFALLGTAMGLSTLRLSEIIIDGQNPSFWAMLSAGLLIATIYTYRSGHSLWGRYDYRSTVVWLEAEGSYETAHMEMGRTFADAVKSGKDVINVEAMTLRVWASEFDTVLFTRDGHRQILAMRGLPDFCEQIATELASFGQNRATIVAPQTRLDMERISHLQQVNQAVNTDAASLPGLTKDGIPAQMLGSRANEKPAAQPLPNGPIAGNAPRFCHQCGQQSGPLDRFCGDCGTALVVAQ